MLFPHEFLPDEQYTKIVAVIDANAVADNAVAMTVKEALAAFPRRLHSYGARVRCRRTEMPAKLTWIRR